MSNASFRADLISLGEKSSMERKSLPFNPLLPVFALFFFTGVPPSDGVGWVLIC
jgi:hypothetical protein